MKPRPGKARRDARKPPPTPARRRRMPPRGGLVAALVLALLLAALAAWFALRARRGVGDAASLSPDAAGATGEALVKEERLLEALPFLRRCLEGSAGARWQSHLQLASFLGTVSVRVVPRAGIEQPLARSSVERVALARECEREYARAWDLAPEGEGRATVASLYAEHLFTWGRVWEAFVLLRTAQDQTPGDERRRKRADLFQFMLEHPERFQTTQEVMLEESGGAK